LVLEKAVVVEVVGCGAMVGAGGAATAARRR